MLVFFFFLVSMVVHSKNIAFRNANIHVWECFANDMPFLREGIYSFFVWLNSISLVNIYREAWANCVTTMCKRNAETACHIYDMRIELADLLLCGGDDTSRVRTNTFCIIMMDCAGNITCIWGEREGGAKCVHGYFANGKVSALEEYVYDTCNQHIL